MRLNELLKFNKIVIQCHDNPDADTISSGFALYLYFKEKGKNVSLVYGGANIIRKSNLVLMIKALEIPIIHVTKIDTPDILITVDCQYGEGNVTHFDSKEIAIIDHHKVTGKLPYYTQISNNLGSCATLVWNMLKKEKFDINSNKNLATALYYGLYTDTNALAEISNPLDMKLRDEAEFDSSIIMKLKNSNISIEELQIAGAALLQSDYMEKYRCATVKAAACDPNILGIISDLILEVDAVDTCLVFNVLPVGVKLSVRSCIEEIAANELIGKICEEIGSGGGHLTKAGGTIKMELLVPEYLKYCEKRNIAPRMELTADGKNEIPSLSAIKAFLEDRIRCYFDSKKYYE